DTGARGATIDRGFCQRPDAPKARPLRLFGRERLTLRGGGRFVDRHQTRRVTRSRGLRRTAHGFLNSPHRYAPLVPEERKSFAPCRKALEDVRPLDLWTRTCRQLLVVLVDRYRLDSPRGSQRCV